MVLELPARRFIIRSDRTAAVDDRREARSALRSARLHRASCLALAMLVTPAALAWQALDRPVAQ